ncbi:hypothetical protein A7982_12697 [Minicystis rosea]|nr:hypothetical protein A7982_12697 [Minicystis rosea]
MDELHEATIAPLASMERHAAPQTNLRSMGARRAAVRTLDDAI